MPLWQWCLYGNHYVCSLSGKCLHGNGNVGLNGNKSFDNILVDPTGRGVGEVKGAPTHKLRVGAMKAHTGNAQNSVR